jgi:hypothetical protein
MSASDTGNKCRWCGTVYTQPAQNNNWCAIDCPYCSIDVLTTMIDKLEALLNEHACAPVQEKYDWQCPICDYIVSRTKNSVPIDSPVEFK